MKSFLIDVLANTVGNLFAWLLLGLVTLYFIRKRSQAKFEAFFGLAGRRHVVVYLSNLWDASLAPPGRLPGSILSGPEFRASQAVSRLFGVSPFSLPELVRGFVDAFFIGRKVEVFIEVCPAGGEIQTGCNVIVVGSTVNNTIRRAQVSKAVGHALVEGEMDYLDGGAAENRPRQLGPRFQVIAGQRKGEVLTHSGDFELVIVEKTMVQNGRVIFFCLGVSGQGSRAAVEYLTRNWGKIEKKYENGSFCRCLWFSKADIGKDAPSWEPVYFDDVYP